MALLGGLGLPGFPWSFSGLSGPTANPTPARNIALGLEARHPEELVAEEWEEWEESEESEESDGEFEEPELPTFAERKWSAPPQTWPNEAAALFVPLGPHTAATRFVGEAPVASWFPATLYNVLCELPVNEFDLQAWLYPKGSHLFTARQLQRLLEATGVTCLGRVLDVGAGDGCHTAVLRAVSQSVVAAETSRGMAWHLEREGYEVWCEDVSETFAERAADLARRKLPLFSLVSVLNVLDRCAAPRKLCSAAAALLEPGGFLLLASPLPFSASYYGPETGWNGQPLAGLEDLGFGKEGEDAWARDGLTMIQDFLPSCGFQVEAVSRLPYLSGGDVLDGGCIELDDILVLARKT